jgi:hypothetical protein
MAFDAGHGVLYVAARQGADGAQVGDVALVLEYGSVESIELATAIVQRLPQVFHEPSGVVFLEETGELVVANGAVVDVLFPDVPGGVPVGADADNLRFDPLNKRVIVGCGTGGDEIHPGELALIHSAGWSPEARIALGAHPESFQLTADGKRAWVNVPDKELIAVVDLVDKKVVRTIALKTAKKNYPMALVEAEKRLLVGCRDPARLLVFDTETDAQLAELPLSGDVDDVFVDTARGLVYASCGEGFVDVFEHSGKGAWKPKEKVATRAGARTCLFAPGDMELFVAVPKRGGEPAELRVFSTGKRER